MKRLYLLLALTVTGCGLFGSPKSPCAGLYCLDVQGAPEFLICYKTQTQMLEAQKAYRANGARATVVK